MEAKPVSDYFDRPCESHQQFEQMKAELEGQGFKYVGNSTTHEPLYHQRIYHQEARGHQDYRMARVRQEQHFSNEVEERTWDFNDQGYQVIRTQGFDVTGVALDDYVAFFVKPLTERAQAIDRMFTRDKE